jgi:hypothetical protein
MAIRTGLGRGLGPEIVNSAPPRPVYFCEARCARGEVEGGEYNIDRIYNISQKKGRVSKKS